MHFLLQKAFKQSIVVEEKIDGNEYLEEFRRLDRIAKGVSCLLLVITKVGMLSSESCDNSNIEIIYSICQT